MPMNFLNGCACSALKILKNILADIIFTLQIFSEGIEHGHIHIHKQHQHAFPLALIIGLCVHSFLEGMPLVQKFNDEKTGNSLLAGIILHHIPVAIALMSMLLDSSVKKGSAF